MTTQVERVRAHLVAGKTITPAVAITVYGIFRLSSVIEDLRNAGVEIDMVLKWDEMGKQYGEYRLRQPIRIRSKVQIKRGHGVLLPQWVRRQRRAEVVGQVDDASLVRFICGTNLEDHWVNNKELVNAD